MIAIYGSGISGLLAAWACSRRNLPFRLFSDRVQKPDLVGFFYLHDNCDLPLGSVSLKQTVLPVGVSRKQAEEHYSMQVYGNSKTPNSVGSVMDCPEVTAWNAWQAVDILWEKFAREIEIDSISSLEQLVAKSREYRLVFSTIPLLNISKSKNFSYKVCFVRAITTHEDNHVYYNGGDPTIKAYRWGSLFGRAFEESCEGEGKRLMKVVDTDLPNVQLPSNLILCGRYGAWSKKQLASDVYHMANEVLSNGYL